MRHNIGVVIFYSFRFNPRICKRCDFETFAVIHFCFVSIHASVKDATYRSSSIPKKSICFNPRICKRCDFSVNVVENRFFVSIHASVKDATLFLLQVLIISLGFNPRICKRCDVHDKCSCKPYYSFNPRICKRCDFKTNQVINKQKVSIHASVKDATKLSKSADLIMRFQSTHL